MDMVRPRLDESTVQAVRMIASHESEFDVSKFDIDTQLRFVLDKYATEDGRKYNEEMKKVAGLVEPYDV